MKNIFRRCIVAAAAATFTISSFAVSSPDDVTTSGSEQSMEINPSLIADFPGGYGVMMQKIADNLQYPAEAREVKAQGQAYVAFTVTAEGRMTDIHIEMSTGNESLDAEALRVVRENLDVEWIPATRKGEPISSDFMLPISFTLEKAAANDTADTETAGDASAATGTESADKPSTDETDGEIRRSNSIVMTRVESVNGVSTIHVTVTDSGRTVEDYVVTPDLSAADNGTIWVCGGQQLPREEAESIPADEIDTKRTTHAQDFDIVTIVLVRDNKK